MPTSPAREKAPPSPSTRRAWIEILCALLAGTVYRSPSTRRAWIEIQYENGKRKPSFVALHPEGVDRNSWYDSQTAQASVALHPEGVDRNAYSEKKLEAAISRPPPGGRG